MHWGGGTCPVSVGHDPPHPQPPSAMNSAAPLQYVPHGVGWTLWSARAATFSPHLYTLILSVEEDWRKCSQKKKLEKFTILTYRKVYLHPCIEMTMD